MKSLGAIAGAFALAAINLPGAASAADLPAVPYVAPVEAAAFVGWYLRGFIGMSNQQVDRIHHPQMDLPDLLDFINEPEFDSGVFFGGGVGYQFNSWFRTDITGEYRGKTSFSALDRYDSDDTGNDVWDGTNDYRSKKSEWLVLANAYFDLGTWHGFTPYVGAGAGAARVTIHDFSDTNVVTDGIAYAGTASKWNFAWALHAGMSYAVTPNFKIDLAYRYLDMGDGETGTLRTYLGECSFCEPVKFENITSHDVMLGVRWSFGGGGHDDYVVAKY